MTTLTAVRAAGAACLLFALAGSAAAQLPQPQYTPQQRADMAEERAFRLTVPLLQKATAATTQFAAAIKADPTYLALMKASDELDALENKEPRTAQENARLAQLKAQMKGNPFADDPSTQSLSDVAAEMNKIAPMATALKANGLTTRDYAKVMIVSIAASIVAAMPQASAQLAAQAAAAQAARGGQQSQLDQAGAALGAGLLQGFGAMFQQVVSPENAAFARDHMDAIQQFMNTFKALDDQK